MNKPWMFRKGGKALPSALGKFQTKPKSETKGTYQKVELYMKVSGPEPLKNKPKSDWIEQINKF